MRKLGCALLASIFASLSAPPPAFADPRPGSPTQAFEIPAQPLGAALRALGTQTRLNLLYENDVVVHRRSVAVAGSMPREAALAAMLQGTGLLFRFTGPDAAVVFPPDRLPEETASIGRGSGAARMMLGLLPITAAPLLGSHGATNFAPYGQSVQAAIDQRVQVNPSMHGRAFAAVLRVNVRADGALHLASLARSTGDAAMDRAIAAAVNSAVAPRSPPDGMPQPIWFELTSHR